MDGANPKGIGKDRSVGEGYAKIKYLRGGIVCCPFEKVISG